MKKILLLILFLLGLGACVNPADKYVESFKKLPDLLAEKIKAAEETAKKLGTDIESTATLLEKPLADLTPAEATEIANTLVKVVDTLKSEEFKVGLDIIKSDPEAKKAVVDAINEQLNTINADLAEVTDPAVKDQLDSALDSINEILTLING